MNEKHKWLNKQLNALKIQANTFVDLIKNEKINISENINEENINSSYIYCCKLYLNKYRNELKEVEKEIRIVKQLIKELK